MQELFEEEKEELIEKTKRIARPLVESCDKVLESGKETGIGVIGTGARDIFIIMRILSKGIKDRGSPGRVKLLDVSTKLLFGRARHDAYLRASNESKSYYIRDAVRDELVFRYLKQSGILGFAHILLIDTGFHGTVVNNLKKIIEARHPEKRVDVMLYAGSPQSGALPAPGIEGWTRIDIAHALEHRKPAVRTRWPREASQAARVGYDFINRRGKIFPRYYKTSAQGVELAKARSQVLIRQARTYSREKTAQGEKFSLRERLGRLIRRMDGRKHTDSPSPQLD